MLSPIKALDDESTVRLVKPKDPPRNAGGYWRPIDFAEVLRILKERFKKEGLRPLPWRVHLSRGGSDMCASMTANWSMAGWLSGLGLELSNERRCSMRFYLGLVSPSDGLASIVTDRFGGGRRHTNRMNLAEILREAVRKWIEKAEAMPRTVQKMSEERLSQSEIEKLVSAAGKAKLLTWSRVGRLLHYMARPEAQPTTIGLLAGFGHVGTMATPVGQLSRQYNFYRLVRGKSLVG